MLSAKGIIAVLTFHSDEQLLELTENRPSSNNIIVINDESDTAIIP
jgi:hypothetical protein